MNQPLFKKIVKMRTKLFISSIIFLSLALCATAQQKKTFDIFSYVAPKDFLLKENKDKLYFDKTDGKSYCQIFVYPAVSGESDVEKDFDKNWNFFARNATQGVNAPETKDTGNNNGWQMVFGAARGTYNKKQFVVTISTFTKGSITYFVASVFSDQKYIQLTQDFMAAVVPDEKQFVNKLNQQPPQNETAETNNTIKPNSTGITKYNSNFDDGWKSSPQTEFVKVEKAGTEVRLHYIDKALDDARPNTIDAPEYYWSKYVEPFYMVSNPEKWSGIEYPTIYFMQGSAVDKQTGKQCYVAIKIVYSGGARPIVVITPDENSYKQLFGHPNNVDRMLNYNKFAITANDITGKWKGSGGGGLEYYNVYSGAYAGMSTISTSDEFCFNNDGSYSSSFRSANTNFGSTQFGAVDYKGKFTVSDWTITATNRHNNKTTLFNAQLSAVKGGYLLFMSDSEYEAMKYILFKTK